MSRRTPPRLLRLLVSTLLGASCGPAPLPDGGQPHADAGKEPDDAGRAPDAGAAPDAGEPGEDAGAPDEDAGTPSTDAGSPGCSEDEYEDNDSRAGATVLTSGETVDARSCDGDDDWFALDADPGCSVEARAELDPSTGDLDLALFGPEGQLLDIASGFSVLAIVQANATSQGRYAVRVRGPSSARTAYRFTLTRVCQAELSCPADDSLEENDDAATARAVSEGLPVNAIACASDSDFYRVSAAPGCVLDVRLDFSHASGDLDLKLYRADGSVSSRSTGTTDQERVLDVVPDEGPQAIEVFGFGDAQNTYRLRADAICPNEMGCPSDDPFEPNNGRDDAVQLEDIDEATGVICGENEDWFRFYAGAGCAVELDLLFAHADGDLDVQIRDVSDQVVASGASSDDNEAVAYTPPAGGTLHVRVYGYQSAQNRYRLKLAQTCP